MRCVRCLGAVQHLLDGRAMRVSLRDVVNTLLECVTAGDVCDNIVNGKILMRDREVLTLDEEKINRIIDALLALQEQEDVTIPALRRQPG